MLILNLPGTAPTSARTIETRPKAVAEWLGQLPFASPAQAAQQLLMSLYTLNRHALDEDDRFDLLAHYRPAVVRACTSLEDLISDAGLPPTTQQRQVGTLLRELHIELGIGYKHVLQALANRRGLRPGHKRTAEVAARLLRALYDAQFACYMTHMPVPTGLWRDTHQVHAFARAAELDQLAIDDAPTPARAYCQAVLIARADPPHMNHVELVHARLFLEQFASFATLTDAQAKSHHGFNIHIEGDTAPSPMTAGPAPSSLWLNTDMLCNQLHKTALRLRTGETPRQIGLPQEMESETAQTLCNYLIKQWCGGPQRAFRRHTPVQPGKVQMVPGLSAIHRLLHPEPLATAGESAPAAQPPIVPSQWTVLNDSAAGLALSSQPDVPLSLRVGDPLALLADDIAQWSLGVIRWIRMRDENRVDLGIERLSPQIQPVWVRPLRGHRTGSPEPALFAPGVAALKQVDRLLLPRHLYQLGMDAEVSHPPRQYTISFGKRLAPAPSFDLIDFSVIED